MLVFTKPSLVVKNTSKKELNLFSRQRIGPGEEVDLFNVIPNLSESVVIDAMRMPDGEIYVASEVAKKLSIIKLQLFTLENSLVDQTKLLTKTSPLDGQVLGLKDGSLAWVTGGGVGGASYPLKVESGVVSLPQAGPTASGYLSREDWLTFHSSYNGFKIWRYFDIETSEALIDFTDTLRDMGYPASAVINGSAVATNISGDRLPTAKGGWFKKLRVQQHISTTVILSDIPKDTVRIWFLVSLSLGEPFPVDYEAPTDFVRKQRLEYFDIFDLNSSRSEFVRGNKRFDDSVEVNKGLLVSGTSQFKDTAEFSRIRVNDGASPGKVLTSNAVGDARWDYSPVVSTGQPSIQYPGQLWLKLPEHQLYIFNDELGRYISHSETSILASDSKIISNSYLSDVNTGYTFDSCYVTEIRVQCANEASFTLELHDDAGLIPGCTVALSSDSTARAYPMVYLPQGKKLKAFINGNNVDTPRVEIRTRLVI